MAVLCAAMFCILELVLYLAGLMPGNAVLQTGALAALASGGFFVVFQLGLNERARDPSLTGLMMTVATGILLYTMATAPIAMQTFGIYLGVILLFGVFKFSGRALLCYAVGSLLAYGATVAWVEVHSERDGTALSLDIARWLVFAGTLPIFAWVGGHINRFRVRMDERKRFHQAIWDACSDVVVVVDHDAIIRYANPATEHVFGRATATLLGQPLAITSISRLPSASRWPSSSRRRPPTAPASSAASPSSSDRPAARRRRSSPAGTPRGGRCRWRSPSAA